MECKQWPGQAWEMAVGLGAVEQVRQQPGNADDEGAEPAADNADDDGANGSPQVLLEPGPEQKGEAGRPGLDRLTRCVVLDVVCQGPSRLVAPLALLRQRLEHDGIEILIDAIRGLLVCRAPQE